MNYDFDQCFKSRLQHSSYKNEKSFIKEINKMGENECRQSTEGDAFDGILNFYRSSNNKNVKVIWDNKSPLQPKSKIIGLKQYIHTKKIMDDQNIEFLYVYLTTYGGRSRIISDDCIIINIEDTQNFFGPIWNIFSFTRGLMMS